MIYAANPLAGQLLPKCQVTHVSKLVSSSQGDRL